MKVLLTVCVLLCFAGSVYMQNVKQDCYANSTCASADLTCQEGKCKAKIGTNCTANSTDECVMTAAACPSAGKCACPTGAAASGDSITCACTDNNKVINMDKTKCVSKVDQQCTGEGDCLAYGQCTNNTCACKSAYTASADKAMCLKKVDETCTSDMECPLNGMSGKCDGGKCKCITKYAATYDMMMCRLLPNQACTGNGDCGENAMCNTTTNVCACKANYINQEGQRCGMALGATCSASKQCLPNAECKDTTCKCMNDFTKDDNGFCSGASAVAASVVLLVGALVSSRWI